jgi:hypothetical protein
VETLHLSLIGIGESAWETLPNPASWISPRFAVSNAIEALGVKGTNAPAIQALTGIAVVTPAVFAVVAFVAAVAEGDGNSFLAPLVATEWCRRPWSRRLRQELSDRFRDRESGEDIHLT